MVKVFNKENPEKTILYAFYVYVLVSIGVLSFNILRNFDSLINPLFHRPIDIYFFTYVLVVILGSFCTYRLVLYYRETYSIQYMMLTVFIFGTAVMLFLWQLWRDYFSAVAVDRNLAWTSFLEPEIIVGLANYSIGMIAILIFAVKLRTWNEYHIIIKILFVWTMYEIILSTLLSPFSRTLLWLNLLPFGYQNDPQFLFNQISIAYYLVQINTQFGFWSKVMDSALLSAYFISLFLVFAYLTTKPEVKTQKIRISRLFWVIYGISNAILMDVFVFDFLQDIVGLVDPFVLYALRSVEQTILLAGLAILLVIAPEALLITRAQIFQAKALYQKSEKGELGTRTPSRFHLLDYKTRFKAYMDSLPSELKSELQK